MDESQRLRVAVLEALRTRGYLWEEPAVHRSRRDGDALALLADGLRALGPDALGPCVAPVYHDAIRRCAGPTLAAPPREVLQCCVAALVALHPEVRVDVLGERSDGDTVRFRCDAAAHETEALRCVLRAVFARLAEREPALRGVVVRVLDHAPTAAVLHFELPPTARPGSIPPPDTAVATLLTRSVDALATTAHGPAVELARAHVSHQRAQEAVAVLCGAGGGTAFDRVLRVLREFVGAQRARVSTVRTPGDDALVDRGGFGPDTLDCDRVVDLGVPGRTIGRVELATPRGPDAATSREVLEAVLPCVTMVLEREALARALAAPVPQPRLDLAALAARWKLTARQAEALRHVAAGRANKEVAAALRCSVANVEFLQKQVLRKSGCRSRAELIARCWTE